jgi:hypothetical protein
MGQDGKDGKGVGRMTEPAAMVDGDPFEETLRNSRRFERRLVWRELLALGVVAVIVAVRQMWCT